MTYGTWYPLLHTKYEIPFFLHFKENYKIWRHSKKKTILKNDLKFNGYLYQK